MSDANAFFGYNDQRRKFTNFSTWESQNWFMLSAEREKMGSGVISDGHKIGASGAISEEKNEKNGPGAFSGRLTLQGMVSLEPFTLKKIGSPQVFQTGEIYQGAPLIDYQHPHDLIMGLGATYRVERGRLAYSVDLDLVGSPALGPTPFMHRQSASDNPQAPLAHHMLDSTHVTPGVVRTSVTRSHLTVEGSIFNGKEPDEHRLKIDRPRLDSWSARAGWQQGSWRAQVSAARVHEPEPFEPYDITRLTASVEFTGAVVSRPMAATAAWGQNRELHGNLDGYLLEWDWQLTPSGSRYGRGERVAKDILDLGTPAPPGFVEFPRISHIDVLTFGYIQGPSSGRWGRLGVGADATVYRASADLREPYGSPHSFHVFLRWHPTSHPSMIGMH